MGIFTENRRLPEIIFKLEKDFEEEVYQNSKLLFGEKSILKVSIPDQNGTTKPE